MTRRVEDCPAVAGNWYAVRTRPQHEFAVANRFEADGIRTFWPTYSETLRWSDRPHVTVRSLFPGYLFAFFHSRPAFVAGVLQILTEPVESTQVESIRCAIDAARNVSPCAYVTGDTIRVRSGPFRDCEGIIERVAGGGRRLIIRVDLLQRAVAVELDTGNVRRNETRH